ncbi:MAG: hypothetical protein WC069_03740 [Candidatus Shapirobacteria bacterium]
MSSKILILFVLIALFTRFFGINWGDGYFSHPDENNMSISLSQLSPSNLNPHFFAYGQFPLYLGYFTLKIINIPNTLVNSIYVLRFYSGIFSLLFLYYSYLLFPSTLFLLLLIFSPGLIQIAHFGTTESLLSFVFIANLYYLISIFNKPKFIYFVISAILSGIALGSKITAVFFIWPIVIIGLYKKEYLSTLFFIFVSCFVFLVSSPYNFIDINSFLSSMSYETGVASGAIDVFYTRQFLNTTPYLFQFIRIFPNVVSLPVFIISILGIYSLIKNFKLKIKNYQNGLLILIPVIIYFLYFGQLFVKWTRFMSPIFFIFPFFASLFISRLKSKYKYILITICIYPGLLFFSQYFIPNPRVSAANWINQNIPQNSTILSESGNVVDLKLRPDIKVINYDFYTLDENYNNKLELDNLLSMTNYVLIPSRRVFKNQNNSLFPYTKDYYKNIFSDKFSLIYRSSGQDENAEETFTVFDFPTIRLYEKK